MTPDEKLTHELTESRLLCAACPNCKQRPQIEYDPGSTRTTCKCGQFDAIPEWNPRAAMRVWNACVMSGDMTPRNRDRQKMRIEENI